MTQPDSLGFFSPGLLQGTQTFACLWAIALVIGLAMAGETKNTTRREARTLTFLTVTISAICMWMFWAFAYMHQMVPLIYPVHTPPTTG